jgi:hypothetical protein
MSDRTLDGSSTPIRDVSVQPGWKELVGLEWARGRTMMANVPGSGAIRFSQARLAIFRLLLQEEHAAWTVREMTGSLAGSPVSAGTIREILYVLNERGIVRTVPHRRTITFVLTPVGKAALRRIIGTWRSGNHVGGSVPGLRGDDSPTRAGTP